MPGFVVRDIGGNGRAVPATARYLYNYSWEIENIFGDNVGTVNQPSLIHLKDATLPAFVVNKEMVLGASLEYKYGKSVTWEDIKVTWYDTFGFLNVVRDWRRRVWTEENGLNPSGAYKRDSIIAVLAPDDANDAARYKLFGSWPSVIRHGDLTYTNSDVKVVEVTVTYDWAEENPSQIRAGALALGGTTL